MNEKSESCIGSHSGPHGSEARSPRCDCGCRRPGTVEDLAVWEAAHVARQADLARGQWTDAGAGLQVRLA